MKLFILVSSILAVVLATWEPIQEKYHGPLHYPKIHKCVPIEHAAVQHVTEAHLNAQFHAKHNHGYSNHHDEYYEHHDQRYKWHGHQHYPVIHKGVPVEPIAVQHAREAHLTALSHASYNNEDKYNEDSYYHGDNLHGDYHYHEDHHNGGDKWHRTLHYPKIYKGVPVEPVSVQHARAAYLKAYPGIHHDYPNRHNMHHHERKHESAQIGHDGTPLKTYEVQAAKAKHFLAVHDAIARNCNEHSHHYRKRRGAKSYVQFSTIVEHELPVYKKHRYDYDDHKEHGYSCSNV